MAAPLPATRHPPGAIVLYSPIRTILWCLRRATVPPLRVWLDLLASVAIFAVSGTSYSHVLHSVGDGSYIHTRMGLIRHEVDFPAGYMETSIAFTARAGYPPEVAAEFRSAIGRQNVDFTVLPLTTVFRLAYKLGFISKSFRERHHTVQCASFVALTWRRAGYDLFKDQNYACYTGLYPGDYMRNPSLVRVEE